MKDNPFPHWPDYAMDAYNEREAIMREANRVPHDAPTPPEIIAVATEQAEKEIYGF
jgi:hypothetical protein